MSWGTPDTTIHDDAMHTPEMHAYEPQGEGIIAPQDHAANVAILEREDEAESHDELVERLTKEAYAATDIPSSSLAKEAHIVITPDHSDLEVTQLIRNGHKMSPAQLRRIEDATIELNRVLDNE